jgi:glycosyltransferase 2 family protein
MQKESSSSGNHTRARLTFVVGALLCCALLTIYPIMRMRIGFRQFSSEIFHHAHVYPWIPVAIVFYLIGFWLRGVRLKLLASEDAQLTVLTAANIIGIGHYANNILPFRLGELVRAAALTERTGLPLIQSLTIAACERVFDGLSIVALLLFAAMLLPLNGWMAQTFQIYCAFFCASIVTLVVLTLIPQLMLNVTTTLTSSTLLGWQNQALKVVSEILRGLSFFTSPKRLAFIIGLSLMIWGLEACFFASILPCFSLLLDLPTAAATMGFTNLGIMSPSSPASLGLYQSTCAGAIQSLSGLKSHVTASDTIAAAYALVTHSIYFLVTTLWGFSALTVYVWRFVVKTRMTLSARPLESLPATGKVENQLVLSSRTLKKEEIVADQFWRLLCEALVGSESLQLAGDKKDEAIANTSLFVVSQLSRLSKILRIQLEIGLRVFRSYAFCLNLQPFCSMSLAKRVAVVEQWAGGPVPLARKMFRPLRSLTLLGFFEESSVNAGLAAKQTADTEESTAHGVVQ